MCTTIFNSHFYSLFSSYFDIHWKFCPIHCQQCRDCKIIMSVWWNESVMHECNFYPYHALSDRWWRWRYHLVSKRKVTLCKEKTERWKFPSDNKVCTGALFDYSYMILQCSNSRAWSTSNRLKYWWYSVCIIYLKSTLQMVGMFNNDQIITRYHFIFYK